MDQVPSHARRCRCRRRNAASHQPEVMQELRHGHSQYYTPTRRRITRRKSTLLTSLPSLIVALVMFVLWTNVEERLFLAKSKLVHIAPFCAPSLLWVHAFSVAIPRTTTTTTTTTSTTTQSHRRYRFEYPTSLGNVQLPQVNVLSELGGVVHSPNAINGEKNRRDLHEEVVLANPNVAVAVDIQWQYTEQHPSDATTTNNGYQITATATTATARATTTTNGHTIPKPSQIPLFNVTTPTLVKDEKDMRAKELPQSAARTTKSTYSSPSLTQSSPVSASSTTIAATITTAATGAASTASTPAVTSSASAVTTANKSVTAPQPTTTTTSAASASAASIPTPSSASATTPPTTTTTRSMWRRRNARSAEEGIRREKTTQLSTLFAKASTQFALAQQQLQQQRTDVEAEIQSNNNNNPRYAARTLTGLINALAEEAENLEVHVESRNDTPLWGKHVDAVRIQFSRLGFKPLRMRGLVPKASAPASSASSKTQRKNPAVINGQVLDRSVSSSSSKKDVATRVVFPDTRVGAFTVGRQLTDLSCADEAFERIDVDNSGALDTDEIAEALTMAASTAAAVEVAAASASTSSTSDTAPATGDPYEYLDRLNEPTSLEYLRHLASELVALYDFNGDGVVDRNEYQSMVEDMAALREEQERLELEQREQQQKQQQQHLPWFFAIPGWVASAASTVTGWFHKPSGEDLDTSASLVNEIINGEPIEHRDVEIVSGSAAASGGDAANAIGSITFSDLKLDLRRLLFGAIPILKHIMPGGPLILEPFTTTVVGSFNQDDIKKSFLLDAGLRRLVAQALKRRVRSLRDLMDGAIFHGRSWKMSSETAPSVQVLELTDVEFDDQNKLILTGRVRVQPRQEVPVIENAFKLRTKIGTRRDGRFIRLVEPELALVLECPKSWEETVGRLCDVFGFDRPSRPEPIYSFFPIYSPFKLDDNDGFDLGADNCIKSIYIEDKALRFELSAVLRPGRFLGNHYLAFTIPNRTFIITLDRVKEGIRAARKTKRAARALREAAKRNERWRTNKILKSRGDRRRALLAATALSRKQQQVPPRSFFSRFVDGYLQAERDTSSSSSSTGPGGNNSPGRSMEDTASDRVTAAIRDFFGRQGQASRQERNGTNSEFGGAAT